VKKIAILNTVIVDGTKKSAYLGHVIIQGDTIESVVEISKYLALDDDVQIIDGTGLILTPGFIDTHSHSDLAILEMSCLEPKIRQGITTEILGQDGISMAPLPKPYSHSWRRNISGLNGSSDKLSWEYESVDGYFDLLEKAGSSSNCAYLLPHGNVRLEVMGFSDADPTEAQLEEMKTCVEEGMKSGCLGLSTGLIYVPCVFSKEKELIELCKVVHKYDGVFVVHQRSEANKILESMDEVIRIGHESGVKIHFSHFKLCGKKNWKLMDKVLKKLDDAKELGVKVSFDMYPYTAGSTMLSAILPPWVHVGGTYDMLHRLRDLAIRKMIREEVRSKRTVWDNFVAFAGVGGIYITSVGSQENEHIVGMSLKEIGKLKKKHPIEVALSLLVEEKNEVGMIDYYGYEGHIKQLIQRDEMNACTDGLLGGKPHPRVYGTYPKIISTYVVEEKLLSLEEAIYKFTGKPAEVFGIKNRGLIREGFKADLVLFDINTIKDRSTYLHPKQYPEGIAMVMVNGQVVFDGEKICETAAGQVLSRVKNMAE